MKEAEAATEAAGVPSLWAPLVLTGTPAGVQAATRLVCERVDDIDEVVAEFQIERTKHSTVIGPKVGACLARGFTRAAQPRSPP